MSHRSGDRTAWDALARANAPWAVVSTPEFASGFDEDDFFASGEREVAAIIEYLADAHGLHPTRDRAIDFGCGLGRLTRALATRFDDVIGVDVSPEMLRRSAALSPDDHVTWVPAAKPEDLRSLPAADFCLSLIALQHVASHRRVAEYVTALVALLKPGGIAVLHVPAHVPAHIRWHPLRLAARALPSPFVRRDALRPYAMQLTPLTERKMRAAVAEGGGSVIAAVEDQRVGSDAVRSLSYVIRR